MSGVYVAKVEEQTRHGQPMGPCVKGTCKHRDCAATHRDAEKVCRICGQPIGYGVWVFGDNEGDIGDLVHRDCEMRLEESCR